MSIDARDVRSTSEEGFHEIQLSGKQLVFLFMATTVVSIVIFLCGVLVGRGVRSDASAAETPAQASVAELTPDLGPAAASPKGAAEAPPTTDEEPPPNPNELSYPGRLSGAKPPADTLAAPSAKSPGPAAPETKGGAAASAGSPASAPAPAATNKASAPAPSAPAGAATTPAATTGAAPGSGKYTVQVAAYAERSQAADLAKKLSGRGYAAYVEAPSSARGAKMYRVRVGSYADKREADRMRQKLQKEGKFKPWVTTR